MKRGPKRTPAHHLMGYPSSTRWWGIYEQDELEQLKHIAQRAFVKGKFLWEKVNWTKEQD